MRTKASTWIYRILVLAMFFATFYSTKFMLDQFHQVSPSLFPRHGGWGVGASVFWSTMSSPMLIAMVTLALVFRSGASIWLFAWMFLTFCVPVMFSILDVGHFGASAALVSVLLAALVGVSLMFYYLVKSTELRAP